MYRFIPESRIHKPIGVGVTIPNQAMSVSQILAKFLSGQAPEIMQPIYYGDDLEQDALYTMYDGDLSDIQTRYYDKAGAPLPKSDKKDEPKFDKKEEPTNIVPKPEDSAN